jgi:hypothetical protein
MPVEQFRKNIVLGILAQETSRAKALAEAFRICGMAEASQELGHAAKRLREAMALLRGEVMPPPPPDGYVVKPSGEVIPLPDKPEVEDEPC